MTAATKPATKLAAFYPVNSTWKIAVDVEGATDGLVPNVPMAAIHKDGHVEHFNVQLWFHGRWSIGRLGLTIPAGVRRAACRIAADGTGLGAAA